MIVKTQAIALKISPFSETSHIVTWLTADHGKIATIIKGAQRPRNSFLGQYDLFYTCELLFYLRLFQGLHIVKECFPLKSRLAFRTYWPGTACASYFAGLVTKIAPFYAPQKNIYALLDTALDFFSTEDSRHAKSHNQQADSQVLAIGLFWFELKLLGATGFAPRLNACLQCRRQLPINSGRHPDQGGNFPAPEDGNIFVAFSAVRGGVFCGQCAQQHKNISTRIGPDSLALLRFWQSSHEINAVWNAVCSERQLKDVGVVLGSFLQYHLETDNTGREIALSLLREHRKLAG